VLQYITWKDDVIITGPVFERHDYGFVFPVWTDLKVEIDNILIDLRDQKKNHGEYWRIHERWYGENQLSE